MREQAEQFRRTLAGAVGASWTAYVAGPFVLSLLVSLFLGFVGAFGTAAAPLWDRLAVFLVLGLGCAVLVALCLWTAAKIAWLASRPVLRRVAIGAAMTPLAAGWIWTAVGFGFLGGPRLSALPAYLIGSAVMAAAMTTLSWAIFGRLPPPAKAPPSAPRFMDRLPFRLRDGELFAVEAEDHYLRVRTSKGSDLILMRFSDALAELEGLAGAQTHRSWWVAKAGIADVRRSGRAVLVLKDGSEAPVSRTHARSLRQMGWL